MVNIEECFDCINTLKHRCSIEGITVLGGEPFDQAETLSKLLVRVHDIGLSVMVYTGYHLEMLAEKTRIYHTFKKLLAQVDILVEGPFDERFCHTGVLWRGSMNQGIVFVSHRYDVDSVKKWLIEINTVINGKIQVKNDYFGAVLVQKHWLEPLPFLVNTGVDNLPMQTVEVKKQKLNDRIVLSWLPELSVYLREKQGFGSPKGLSCIIQSDESFYLYGFQKPQVIRDFQQQLQEEGIHLGLENI